MQKAIGTVGHEVLNLLIRNKKSIDVNGISVIFNVDVRIRRKLTGHRLVIGIRPNRCPLIYYDS